MEPGRLFFCAFCDMLYQMEDDCRLCRRCVTDLYQRWVSIPRRNSLVSHEMVSGGTAGGVWGKRRRAGLGATLHVIEREETAEMTEPFAELFEPHRYKVFYGGRGSGKSWAVARALIAIADFCKVRILCCREVQNSIRDSSYQTLKDMAQRMGLADRFTFKEAEIVNEATGSKFIFSGLLRNENSIRSKEGIDICWVEEASSVSQASWDVLTPTIRKPGSELWLTFNPLTVDDPTNVFLENPLGQSFYYRSLSHARFTDKHGVVFRSP